MGEIFDWTEPNPLQKCKRCDDLWNVSLCSIRDYVDNGLANKDVSGNRPKLEFTDCRGRSQLNDVLMPSYGKCQLKDDITCGTDGLYHDGVRSTCVPCETHGEMSLFTNKYYSLSSGSPPKEDELFCQIKECDTDDGVGRTGVADNGNLCLESCQTMACGKNDISIPCVLPHLSNRCVRSSSKDTGGREAENSTRASTNLLDTVDDAISYHYASFENLLINLQTSSADLHQCVWNAIDIKDNDMNPGGISHSFYRPEADYGFLQSRGSKFCNAWDRDYKVQYPLLPLQNAVSFEGSRHVYVNTSARVMQYWSDDGGYDGTGLDYSDLSERVAGIQKLERPSTQFGQAGTDLDLFLNLDMRQANKSTMSMLLPNDRGLDGADWVPQWSLSAYVRESTQWLDPITYENFTVRFDFDTSVETLKNATSNSFLQLSMNEDIVPDIQLIGFNPLPSAEASLADKQTSINQRVSP